MKEERRSRLRSLTAPFRYLCENARQHPTAWLAVLALASVSIYIAGFTRVFNVYRLYDRPLLDLPRLAKEDPTLRLDILWCMLALGVLYILGWLVARHARGRLGWVIVLGGALLCAAALLFIFPYDAADIFDYIVHGRIVGIYGYNPFLVKGSDFEADPFRPYMGWPHHPSTYGPAWVVLSGITARLAGDGIIANILAFKLLPGVFLAASVAIVALILSRKAPERALAGTLLLAWNPLALYATFGHGHNDMAMLFWVLLAVLEFENRRYTSGILSLTMGTLFKFIPLLFIPAAVLIALREHKGLLSRARLLILTGAAAAALLVVAYLPFWRGLETIGIFSRRGLFTTSLPAVAYVLLEPWIGHDLVSSLIGLAAGSATIAFALWMAVRAYRDRSWLSLTRAAFLVTMFYLLLTCTWFQEWYGMWPVGLAALMTPDLVAGLGIFFSFSSLSKPLLFAPYVFWFHPERGQPWLELNLGPPVMASAWVYSLCLVALWLVRSWRNLNKRS